VGEQRQKNTLGKASQEQILKAAELILIRDGYHKLSTRRVADACGISVGNLTYHFPNKALLIEAVMSAVCDRYERQQSPIPPTGTKDPHKHVTHTIRWMLNDAVNKETSALFLELWVLAKHNDFGTEILEHFYATAIGWMTKALASCFPDTTNENRKRAAYFLLTLSEGSVAVFSRPVDRPVNHTEIIEFAVAGVMTILGKPAR